MQRIDSFKSLTARAFIGIVLFAATCVPVEAAVPSFRVVGCDEKPWTKVFESVGISAAPETKATIVVAGSKAPADVALLASDHLLILEGDSEAARKLGIVPGGNNLPVRQIVDTFAPKVQIVWSEQVSVPQVTLPPEFQVFAQERWKKSAVEAGKRTSAGAVFWVATSPGSNGMDRYPYLLNALTSLGLTLPFRTNQLWAFFDSAYRSRADVEYLARLWRRSGISALQVAMWHNMEPDQTRDTYLDSLIAACHRNAILVYAWMELPHVSDEFWEKHPEWREKTATGQDAQLDWRKLMNLQNPDCKRAVSQQIGRVLERFDWDGVNSAELYFESLEGASNPARFTPMNTDVRKAFENEAGFDPARLFDPAPGQALAHQADGLRQFLEFRSQLAAGMQDEWLAVVDRTRTKKPWLDTVLTHIDDRLDRSMHDALDADTSRSLPAINRRHATLLLEDPAPLWSLGAARYTKLAQEYAGLQIESGKLAVDLNVVERYQDVYPTKKQTGIELLQLVREAARSFPRVAVYFENSIERQDLELLPAAAATARVTEISSDEVAIDSARPVWLSWSGPAEVDGKLWPFQNKTSIYLPAGRHRVSARVADAPLKLIDFNGDLGAVSVNARSVEFSYSSHTRAVAVLSSTDASVEIDGAPGIPCNSKAILLPAGDHLVVVSSNKS
jgi:hypothetical protein